MVNDMMDDLIHKTFHIVLLLLYGISELLIFC